MSKEEKNPFGLLHKFIRKVINHINTYTPTPSHTHALAHSCVDIGFESWITH